MRTATLTLCGIALLTASPASEVHPATWTPLAHKPSVNSIGTMVLLTDGSVMMESYDDIQTWIKLTPDAKGGYVNGTWSTLAKMRTPRLYFASQVMQNGKLWVMGGEYTGPYQDANWGPEAEIYDPRTNTWSDAATYRRRRVVRP
ncbi:MAG: hypothetical protein JO270_23410 [Acidobacteriaceae bacterium]|nr:hypothetical protein [Acidobacteriaceae bacterium]